MKSSIFRCELLVSGRVYKVVQGLISEFSWCGWDCKHDLAPLEHKIPVYYKPI